MIAAAVAVSSIDYNLDLERDELDRLRALYGARIAAHADELFARETKEADLVRQALETSKRTRTIRRGLPRGVTSP